RQLFGHPQRMLDDRQRVADQQNPRLLGQPRQDRGLDVHHASHAERVAVMLIQRDDVESQFFRVQVLVDEVVIVLGRPLAIEVAIRDCEMSAIAQYHFLGNPARRTFGEIPYLHSYSWIVLLSQKTTDYSDELGRVLDFGPM